jgi:helix-turn-helix protein
MTTPNRIAGEQEPWLRTKEAARHVKMSPRTLERWRVQGDGPVFSKAGPGLRARVLYRRSDLDAWLVQREHRSTREYGGRTEAGDTGPPSSRQGD